MRTRKDRLLDFIDRIYTPRALTAQINELRRIVLNGNFRAIEEQDAHTMHENCIVIETKGRGKYETFKNYYVCRVDIGDVGPVMADVAIYYDINFASPQRVNKGNIKINLPE